MPFRKEYPFVALNTDEDGGGDEPPTLRPCLAVVLQGPKGDILETPIDALIDSGADRSVFPVEFAEPLGVKLAECRRQSFDSADGDGEEFVWDEPLTATFDDQTVVVTAAFASAPVALLGREDFFARYRVVIDQRELSFTLQAYDE